MINSINDIKMYDTKVYNCVINTFDTFVEYVVYNHDFTITTGNCAGIDLETGEVFLKNIADRSRKFEHVNGVLTPVKDFVKIENVKRTLVNSRKRSLDNLFGYVLSNKWDYFFTFTFDPAKVDRDNYDEIVKSWSLLRMKMQYYSKLVKIIAIPEPHPTSGKLHIHALVGNIDLSRFLVRAYNPHTGKPIFSKGRAVYNLTLFSDGFSTCVRCDGNPLKVANYIAKYVIKDFGNTEYNKKAFFHTNNLNFKNKEFVNIGLGSKFAKDFYNTLNLTATVYKKTDDFTVYRQELPFH